MADDSGMGSAAFLRTYIRRCFAHAFPGSIKIADFWDLLFAAGIAAGIAVVWKDNLKEQLFIVNGTWADVLFVAIYVLMASSLILLLRMIFVAPYKLYCELKEQVARNKFPLYMILRMRDDRYRIVLAVAGFTPDEISVTEQDNQLTISGQKVERPVESGNDNNEGGPLGVFGQSFERRFNLADNVEVQGASFENGLLQIDVHELVNARKARRINIRTDVALGSALEAKLIDHPKVA
jgi:molecular chaperone IbpA